MQKIEKYKCLGVISRADVEIWAEGYEGYKQEVNCGML